MESPYFEGPAGTFIRHYFSAMSQNFNTRLFSRHSFQYFQYYVRVKSTINGEYNMKNFLGGIGDRDWTIAVCCTQCSGQC